jgi:hypothetical protein
MTTSLSLPGWHRPVATLASLAFVSLGSAACNEQTLSALSPDFDIQWAEEAGFDAADFGASVLSFGTVTTGDFSTIDITLSNPGSATLDFCDMYLAIVTFTEDGAVDSHLRVDSDPELSLNIDEGLDLSTIGVGDAYTVGLAFTPLFGSPLAENLHLVVKHELNWDCTDDEGTGLYIPIVGEGFGEPQPDIYSKPEEVDFGTVTIGDSSDVQDVLLGNAGPGLLTVSSVFLDDDTHFSLDEGTAINSYTTGDTGFMHVRFAPTSQGNHSAVITVVSDDPDEPQLQIPIFGVADPEELGKGPVAVCGLDFNSAPFQLVSFDGSASYDPDGLPLTYTWILNAPPGSGAVLSNFNSATPATTLDLAGDYTATLTISNTNNQTDSCDQTVTAVPNENFRIEMFWGLTDDMDLHLLEANDGNGNPGQPRTDGDCYFSNCNTSSTWSTPPDWGMPGVTADDPGLDLDDIQNTGPENINIVAPAGPPYDGEYIVFVHDFSGSTTDTLGPNDVTVNIYLNGVLSQTYSFQISGDDDDYYVARIHWPTGVITACNGVATSPAQGCP